MGLTANQFANTNANFATVTFNVTDGYITIGQINATVTVTGNTASVDYDGEEHKVNGYVAVASTNLYDVAKDFTFSGTAEAKGTNAGTYNMGLTANQFANTNANFATVTFNVTDGYITIDPINATVTVTGNTASVDYDGEEHKVNGYVAVASTNLYDVAKDFTFSGTAEAKGTNAGTYNMGLTANQFANTNANFATVTFNVTDGYITINQINATVTITGNTAAVDYDGAEHKVNGYVAAASTNLYDVAKDFTFSGAAEAKGTNAGTYNMGLTANQFANTNANFATVTFNVTDGCITIAPISAVVTVTGHTAAADYDGELHTVSGYDLAFSNPLYKESDFTFSGTAEAKGTDVGTYNMGLTANQFANTNANFATVTFNVTDGCITIAPINVTVTITGRTAAADYDGELHTVTGYDPEFSTPLYKESDFTFSGIAEVKGADAGTYNMGLAAEQFENINANFMSVTFVVTDGRLVINTVDAVITTVPVAEDPIYDGTDKKLVLPGEAEGGTLYYAVNQDPVNAPSDSGFTTSIPAAKGSGSYYVWYKVASDANHNDLPPVSVRVILAEEDWVELSGTLYQSDGVSAIGGAVVTLMKGSRKVDYLITAEDGKYRFIVPAGVYSIVVEYQRNVQTAMSEVFSDMTQDTVMSGGKTESQLFVNGGSAFGIAVNGLKEEANSIREAGNIPFDNNVSVMMTVESKTASTALSAEAIRSFAKNKSLIFFDAKVEKTVDSITTVLNETANVLEIAVPYAKAAKRGVAVYYSDGAGVRELRESSSKEAGTFTVDKEKGLVYIYSNRFATFAVGYTPYYKVESSVSLGSFEETVTVTVTSEDGATVFMLENVGMDEISFADIPKGQYTMTVTWEDGAVNTLTFPLTIGGGNQGETDQSEGGELDSATSDGAAAAAAFTGAEERVASAAFMLAARPAGAIGADRLLSGAFSACALAGPSATTPAKPRSDNAGALPAFGGSKRGYLRL